MRQELAGRGCVVDLQRRVLDPELLAEHVLEVAAPLVAVVVGLDDDVGGDRVKPDVTSQMCRSWTSTMPGWAASVRPIASGSTPGRRALEQHRRCVAQQPPARGDHQRGDDQRRDAVELGDAGEQDERRRTAPPRATRRGR